MFVMICARRALRFVAHDPDARMYPLLLGLGLLALAIPAQPIASAQSLPIGVSGQGLATGQVIGPGAQGGLPPGLGGVTAAAGQGIGGLPAGGLIGAPGTANRLACPPGTQGITCFDASPASLLARPGAAMNAAADLQRGLSQRATVDEPTQFQRHVERLTGRWLPIFGLNFFNEALLMRTDGLRAPALEFANPSDYVLGVGDEVIVNIWGQTESAFSLLVDPQGQITLPRVGPVSVAGLKLAQLEPFLTQQLSKTFSNFRLSVRAGQLKSIQVYVVGHVRQPGAFVLSSQATALAALQLAGGPSPTGSLRRIMVMREGKPIASLDLYRLITQGDTSANLRLMQGDSLLVPPAGPRVALTGQTDQAAIYELAERDDSLQALLDTAGLNASALRQGLLLERLLPNAGSSLEVVSLSLNPQTLAMSLRDGDLLSVQRLQASFANAVTLRGHVARPLRHAWRAGMRVKDLVPEVAALVTADFHERKNALVQYEAAVATGRVGSIALNDQRQTNDPRLLTDAALGQAAAGTAAAAGAALGNIQPQAGIAVGQAQGGGAYAGTYPPAAASAGPSGMVSGGASGLMGQAGGARDVIAGTPYGLDPTRRLPGQRPPSEVRNLLDEIHWDYAVIERISPKDLSLELLPFNLGKLLLEGDERHNLALEPGDVLTIFGKSDLRIPQHRQQRLIRVEGEVQAPGFYLAADTDDLQSILEKAGGLSPRAYVFGLRLTRESLRQEQRENLVRLIKNLQDSQANVLAQAAVSVRSGDGASSALNGDVLQQLRLQQQRVIDRLIRLEPEGRIALGLAPEAAKLTALPRMALEHGDRIVVPARPSAISVQGASFSENPMLWREGQVASDVIRVSGTPAYADIANGFVLRADGSTLAFNATPPETLRLMPGDTIVIPEIADRRTNFWKGMDLARAWTTVFSQIGISLVAIKTLFLN